MPQAQRSMTESLHPYSASASPFPSPGSFVTNPHSPSFFPSPTVQEAGSPFAEDQAQGCPRIMPAVEYSSLAIPRTATPETSSMEQASHYTPSVCSADGAGTPFSSADHSNAPSPFQPNLDGLGIHMPDSSSEDREEAFQATIRPQRTRARPHSFHGDSNTSLDNQPVAYQAHNETVSAGPTPSISMPGRMSDVLGYPSNASMASGMSSFRSVSDGADRQVKIEMPQSVAIRSATSDWRARKARLSHSTQPYPLLSHSGEQSNMRLKLHPIDQAQPGWMMGGQPMALAYQPYPVGYGANGEPVYATQMSPERGDMSDQSALRTSWVQPGAPPQFPGQTYNGPLSACSPINSPYHLATPNPSMYYSCDPTALQGQGQPSSAPSSYAQPGPFSSAVRMRPPPNAHLYSPALNYAPSPEMNRPPGEPIMVKQEMEMTPLRSSESDLSGPEEEESGSEYEPSPRYRPVTLKTLRQVSNSSLQSSASSSYRPKNRHSRAIDPPIEALIQKRPRGRSVAIDPSQVNAKKTYMCDIGACNLQPLYFGRREHLKRHMMGVHTNQKPYVCSHPECGKAFSRSDNRNHHEKKVHSIYHR